MTQIPESLAMNDGFDGKIRRLQTDQYLIYKECLQARRAGDPQQEEAAGLKLINNDRELRGAMKAEALRFAAEVRGANRMEGDRRVAQLLVAFVRGTRLARLWRDVALEPRIAGRRGQKVYQIRQMLAIQGRLGDLEILVDHADLAVRASAAAWLLPLMPDKCLPILKDINEKSHITFAAGLTAFWAVEMWEHEQKRQKTEDVG